ncbi:MAG: metallophosphoesterase family protein [Desulfuromonadales bacterium]
MPRYAIGDIHGGSQTFRALLDSLNLKHSDRLYLLGDYVDRGPDSKGVLDIILSLMDVGYDVRPMRGNHDDMMLRTFTGEHDDYSWNWMKGWGSHTLKSFGVENINNVSARYLTFLDALPYCRHDENFLLVHAGLDMLAEDPLTETSPGQMLWGESALLKGKGIKGKTLVVGHHIRPITLIEVSLLTNHIFLDNGAFTNQQPDLGNLVALNLNSMELTRQPWLDGVTIW